MLENCVHYQRYFYLIVHLKVRATETERDGGNSCTPPIMMMSYLRGVHPGKSVVLLSS